MNPFIIAALVQAGVAVGQTIFNTMSASNAESRNVEFFNRFNKPNARAEDLRNAGLSDAAIGQALTGYNGSGTTIQAVQPQVPDYTSSIGKILDEYNTTRQTTQNIAESIKNMDLTDETIKKVHEEYETAIENKEIAKINKNILKSTMQNIIDNSNMDNEAKKAELAKIVEEYEAAKKDAKFKKEFLDKWHIPYDGGKYTRELALYGNEKAKKLINEVFNEYGRQFQMIVLGTIGIAKTLGVKLDPTPEWKK